MNNIIKENRTIPSSPYIVSGKYQNVLKRNQNMFTNRSNVSNSPKSKHSSSFRYTTMNMLVSESEN